MTEPNANPAPGDVLSLDQLSVIFEAVQDRQKNFPEEPAAITLATILLHWGDQYAHLTCSAGEWEGVKADIPSTLLATSNGDPKCPNGHDIMKGYSLRLGWVPVEQIPLEELDE